MEYLDAKTIYTILHILGAVVGAGAALMSHAMFFISFKDRVITPVELRFLRLGSHITWIGLALLFLSGALLFGEDPAGYLASSKFLVKMTVVLVLIINGLFFHYLHLPFMMRNRSKNLLTSPEFVKESKWLVSSGAVSAISWITTIVLGVMRGIPYSYSAGMSIYLTLLAIAVVCAIVFRRWVLLK